MKNYKSFTVAQLLKMGNPSNPRWMPESQMDALVTSISEFGCVEEVIVNVQTNQIVGGHQRVQAAQKAGIKKLECVTVDLTPDKEMALNLMLNKVKGEWDYEKLALILADFEVDDLSGTGFSITEMDAIVESASNDANLSSEEVGVVAEVRNRTAEEISEQLESTKKIQFGMFTRHVNSRQYSEWVDKLETLSTAGNSPAALGLVVSQMLGLDIENEVEETNE